MPRRAARKLKKGPKPSSKAKPRARKPKAATRGGKAAGGSAGRRLPRFTGVDAATAFRIAVPLAVIAAIAAGLRFGVPELHDSASRRIRADLSPVMFDLPVDEGSEQSWMRDEFLSELHRVATEQITHHPDVLSPDQLHEMRRALSDTGWFKEGPFLNRVDDAVHVTGKWRVPAAAVRYESREYLVSWSGELLPRSYDPGQAAREGLRVVTGDVPPPPADSFARLRYGEPWRGVEVKAALLLLQQLYGKPYVDQVAGVAVEDRFGASTPRLVIITDSGGRVVWGVRPGESGVRFGEVDAKTKLANLDRLYEEYGRIDAGRREVTVYGHVVGERGR